MRSVRVDPEAIHDLLSERPDDAARLRARLLEWLRGARELGWAGAAVDDPALIEQLRQLGYVAPAVDEQGGSLWEDDACAWCRTFPVSDG